MHGTSDNQDSPIQKGARHPLYCRIILAVSAIGSLLLNVVDQPLAETTTLILCTSILIYTFIAHIMSKGSTLTTNLLAITDGALMALVASELNYDPWPCLTIAAILHFNAVSRGGIIQWILVNIGITVGIAAGFFLLKNQTFGPPLDYIVNLPIALGAIAYLCIYGIAIFRYRERVDEQHLAVLDQVKELKLKIYEISRYIPKPIWRLIEGKKKAKIERKPITIFFSDIVGFSSLSEELEAETLSAVLSSYLNEMSKVVSQFNGTIDKFIGDAIMVTFGDDPTLSKGVKQDAIACVSMALAMGKRMRELQPIWAEMGIKRPLQIRIGINSGYCTVGTFGTSQFMDHTALGVHVNLASRLESAGQPEEILVSHETWNLIKDTVLCKDKGKIKAKGFTHPVQVFQVINHRRELGSNQSYFSETTDGFSMHLDMQKVKNYDREKVITSLEHAAKKLRDKFSVVE